MIVPLVLLALLAGSLVYSALTVIAALRYRRVRPPELLEWPPISVLKPLAGMEEGLEDHLRSFFQQDYPRFEILFAAAQAGDPALAVAERLRQRYPATPSRIIVTGESPWPNAKDYSLHLMLAAASHDLVVMADSDVQAAPGLLAAMAADFQDPDLSFVTCPYRAAPGRGIWSALEALGMNTEMLGGVLVSRMLEGMKIILGPVVGARRPAIAAIGGFAAIKDYTSDDFMMGQLAAERGLKLLLSSFVVEHHIGSASFAASLKHRLRWNRAMRRLRPLGYALQVFMKPLPLAFLLWATKLEWWPLVWLTAAVRAASAWATAGHAIRDRFTLRRWWLIPLADAADFVSWIVCFFGNSVEWRGKRYRLLPNGAATLAGPSAARSQ